MDEDLRDLAYGWFYDVHGRDITVRNGVSIGEILAPVLWQGFASIYRNYKLYDQRIDKKRIYVVPFDSGRIANWTAEKLGVLVKNSERIYTYSSDESLHKKEHLPINYLSGFFRFLQIPFRKHLVNRILVIGSRSSRGLGLNDSDYLHLFGKSLFNGAAPILKSRYRDFANSTFPSDMNIYGIDALFFNKARSQSTNYQSELASIFCDYAKMVYVEMRESLVLCHAYYCDLLDHYKPSMCILPSDSFCNFIIIYQLCKIRKITSVALNDGHPALTVWPQSKYLDAKDWLCDYVVAFGRNHAIELENKGFETIKIIPINPFFNFKKSFSLVKYDVIVLSWFTNALSSDSKPESTATTLRSALQLAIEMNFRKVAVKIKSDLEIEYISQLLGEFEEQIEVLRGSLIENAGKGKLLIGGISSAINEANFANVPYYVFDPLDNGYGENWIKDSSVFNANNLARTKDQLRDNILAGRSINNELFNDAF